MPRLLLQLGYLGVLLCFGGSAQAQLGASVGLNFNRLSDIHTGDTQATFENSQGWHIALWLDIPLGPVAVRPGLRYMDAGALYQGASDEVPGIWDNFNVSLLEIPVDLRYRLTFPLLTPYVMAGPVLRFPTGADPEIKDNLERLSLAGSLGVGVEVNLLGLRLYPELQYTFGVSRFTKGFAVGDVTIEPDARQHLNVVMLRLGIGL